MAKDHLQGKWRAELRQAPVWDPEPVLSKTIFSFQNSPPFLSDMLLAFFTAYNPGGMSGTLNLPRRTG